MTLFFLLLALGRSVIPATPPAVNYPCDGVTHVQYWLNPEPGPIYLKRLVMNHQAAAGMLADIHVTVWHGGPSAGPLGARVILIAPWDRYDMSPKPPAVADFGDDYYEVRAGEHLAFESFCAPWPPQQGFFWHLPQPQFWYVTEP
jgi:hypothetical protein